MRRFYEILNPGGIFGFILYSNGCQYKIYQYLAEDPVWGKYFGVSIFCGIQFTTLNSGTWIHS